MTFVGEGAVDNGGPRREFLRMLASEASELFFIGSDNVKFFSMNATALQVCSIGLIMIILILNVCAGQSIQVPWSIYSDEHHSRRVWYPFPCSTSIRLY